MPQFDGLASVWGNTYGGVTSRAACSNLPAYPICGTNPQDSLINLCQFSFDKSFRLTNNGNPTITSICEVACPSQLIAATGIHRSDGKNPLYICNNNLNPSGGSLTRTMDCTKPSYGWQSNVGGATYPGYSAVIPCRRDGFTRINQMSPTTTPTPSQTSSAIPTYPKTSQPSSPTFKPTSKAPSTLNPTKIPSKTPTGTPKAPSKGKKPPKYIR
mmetsp:Transcript_1523/g.2116  ORF Transcript_1523/g.2116 Transcript_1523/m.2116 type:complete len:214 (+) Transcript_1523:516-1157(+)|eukprot:CAMPEP_0170096602 /NCGR_PEP_ID=MMETSP0019_2-20121128/28697_1 /TAXON_ID=98059 /ORGANISM="Dinobryon sp., Strain UTEXLB2267" /LENGTH=213 /DNA_ID=CAMNT_0010318651 /DNA_START=420 /DNA_END=1061 /DNA_ORIENTATION=-